MNPARTALSVNLNKVALVRNTRHLGIPSVTRAATLCLQAGAHGITVHPRPDERHIRTGDVFDYETGMKLNQLFPGQYAPKAAAAQAPKAPAVTQGKTREEVRAEAAEAIRTGDIVDYETGLKLNQLFPGQYASKPTAQAQARDKAEATQTASAGN